MEVTKATNFNNPHIGLFARSSESIVAFGASVSQKLSDKLSLLEAERVEVSLGNSGLAGIFISMNSNGAVVPSFCEQNEVDLLKEKGLNVLRISGGFSAAGNNISANDFGAVANPGISREDVRKISDCLGVEVVQKRVAGYLTVGSCLLATNKGFLAHNRASEEELKELKSILRVDGQNCTLNAGVPFISICAIANSHCAIFGEATTGFETGRAASSLGLA